MVTKDSATGATPKFQDKASGTVAEANAQLKAENRKLRELKEYRSAQIAHFAHELRTPLTSILGFAEILLSQEKISDAQRNFCERIQNSAHQLQRTLTQLSEVARADQAPDTDSQESAKK
jgi:signal transduction histidine kinase